MNKRIKKTVSLATAAVLACTGVGVYVVHTPQKPILAETTEEKEAIEKAINDNVEFTTTGEDKEETVYVLTDANGAVTKTIVSDWLKNKEGSETIEDRSNLENIENVKTDADYTKGTEGEIIWNAEGQDVYYQGDTNQAPPVEIKITYLLNGKEMSAEEIAGKSGKVTIRFTYTNKEKREVEVNGRKEEFYVPFTMISGMILDADKFSNVEVNSGKVISDGSRYIVAGLAFPGMNENLQSDKLLKENQIEFPDTVEVSAEAEDFELGLTLTMGSADLLAKVNVDEVASVEELNQVLDKLVSATGELKSGTTQLKGGLSELHTNFDNYSAGVKNLISGVSEIHQGVSMLNEKSGSFAGGLKSVLDGVDTIIGKVSGEDGAQAGADKLAQGAQQVDQGVGTLQASAKDLTEAIGKLETGAGTVDKNLGTAVDAFEDRSETEKGLTSGSRAVADGVAQLQKQLSDLTTTLQTTITQNETKIGQCQKVLAGGISPETGAALNAEEISYYQASIQQLTGANAALSQTLEGIKPEEMQTSLTNLSTGAEGVASGIAQVQKGLKTLKKKGTEVLATGLTQVNGSMPALTAGVEELKTGTEQVAGGAVELAGGVHTLGDALQQNLRPGVNTLYEGSMLLQSSVGTLFAGTQKASDGSVTLGEATDRVSGGIATLYQGSAKLDTGMESFKEEAVDKTVNFAKGDLKEALERVKAVMNIADDYKIFSDAKDGASTSVKFIYESEGIEIQN